MPSSSTHRAASAAPEPRRAAHARSGGRPWRGPALLALAGALVAAVTLRTDRELAALAIPGGSDQDGDLLVDDQEIFLGTSMFSFDTDGDGWSDLEEVARQSDPTSADSTPEHQSLGVGLTARAEGASLTVVNAVYVKAGTPMPQFKTGIFLGGMLVELGPGTFLKGAKLAMLPGKSPSDVLLLLETPYPAAIVTNYGSISFYSTLQVSGGPVAAAAALNLFDFDGVIVAMQDAPPGVGGGAGSIFKPLPRPDAVPPTWTPGQVCWQFTSPVGTSGPGVVLEVESASCEPVDSSCNASACAASVGGTITVLDPGGFLGGQ